MMGCWGSDEIVVLSNGGFRKNYPELFAKVAFFNNRHCCVGIIHATKNIIIFSKERLYEANFMLCYGF